MWMAAVAMPAKEKENRWWKCSSWQMCIWYAMLCGGKRFKEEVLEVQYKGKSIHDVLEMSVDEAIRFFSGEQK